MAMLLIPHINELRQARKAPLVPESHFYQYEPPTGVARPASAAPLNEDLMALVRRLRHMYQTGLLKVLQGVQVKPSLGMMCRAMDRLDAASGTAPFGNLWWVASAAFTAISDKDMQLTKGRKLLFSALDREIKRLQMEGKQSLARQPDKNLLKDLLYIVALSRATDDKVRAVATAYDIKPVRYTDAELAREMEFLKGPSANTLNSMAAVLSDELRSTKNILERAAQGGAELLSETPELVDTLKKVADILSVVGLVAPSTSLKQEIEKIAHWQKTKKPVSPDELLGVADTLLYVESTISGLGKVNLSDEKLAQINALSRDDAMAHSQIAEAERLVIEEAESGLAMVKRALSSFIESNYDKAHIHNIVGTLDSVRGGMFVLGLSRAAKVLAKCIEFIEVSLLRNEQMAAVQHMLETFADAIISLEYYLDSIKIDKNADTSVLEIAEESLEALGYRV